MAESGRFTQYATNAMQQAEMEAMQLRSRGIEAEHLLIALCAADGGVGAMVLRDDLGLDAEKVRAVVASISANFAPAAADGTRPVGSRSLLDVTTWAAKEASSANHHYIGTEHLLLGLTDIQDRPTREAFKRLNLRPDDIRAKVHARVPEIPLEVNGRSGLKTRFREEFRHNIAYYLPQPIRKLFSRIIDPSQPPPLG